MVVLDSSLPLRLALGFSKKGSTVDSTNERREYSFSNFGDEGFYMMYSTGCLHEDCPVLDSSVEFLFVLR